MSGTVRGIPQTKAALTKIGAEIELASPEAVGRAGEVVASRMRSTAPRRTGALAAAISVDTTSLGEGASARVGSDVPYDRFVQKGTVYMGAQPYGEDAASSSESGVVAAMIAVYRAAVT